MTQPLITCTCGAKIRLPEGSAGRSLRCPKCKEPLATPVESKPLPAAAVRAAELEVGQDAVCPICQTEFAADETCLACPDCDQVHHQECWEEVGGCGTYGCQQAPAIDKSEATPAAPLSAWGDTKKCPACGEQIKSIAMRCRYCHTDFDTVDPMSAADLRRGAKTSDATRRLKNNIVALFVLAILGCPAPFVAFVAPIYFLPRREQVAKAGPLFVIMGYTAIAISWLYLVLLVGFWLTQ